VYLSVVELAEMNRALLEQSTGILQRLSTMSPPSDATEATGDANP
jgi:hypothetical protein